MKRSEMSISTTKTAVFVFPKSPIKLAHRKSESEFTSSNTYKVTMEFLFRFNLITRRVYVYH